MAAAASAHSYSAELDIRVEDYLDDKLQSSTDFDSLDSLLASVEVQRSQLQAQLEDAARALEHARNAAQDRQGGILQSITEFRRLQESIDARMRIVVESNAPEEAARRLERPMKQLHKVELAHNYVSLLRDVESLRLEARSHLPQSPKAALQPYSKLKQLGIRLRDLQGAADGAATHLVNYVESTVENLWDEMKNTMSKELENILKVRNWPQAVNADTEMDDEWLQGFEKLVDLQVPEVLYSDAVVTLLPFEVMAKPFVQWFRFQFMGDNTTSTPQSFSTFCIPQFLSLVDKWEGFFRDNVGYILASRFHDTKVREVSVYVDPACSLIVTLLPVMREKINAMVQHGLQNPQFLSSLIVQLMDLDDEIRSRFNYDGGDPEKGWAGLTSEVLEKHFEDWFKVEREFALERYHAIMDAPDARNIDYDHSVSGKMKPTLGAVRVVDLLKSVTSQYVRVRRFSFRLRFLINIQLDILDEYHDRFKDSLDAYYTITSTLGRTIHGMTKEQSAALAGTGALETLCRVLGSSDYIIAALKDWSNEEFFITMWEELQTRAKRTDSAGNVATGMSYDQVKDRTSIVVGSDGDGGILFDETIVALSRRRQTAQEYLATALVDSHHKAFRSYLAKAQWTTISNDSHVEASQLSVTPELDEPLAILERNLTFLASTLSTAVYRRVWREALEKLQDALWTHVLLAQSFTALGAAQFDRDLDAISSLVDRHLPDGSTAIGALRDGSRLLNLPAEASDGAVSLRQASDRVFTDNAEAKKLLAELGLESLTPANARKILQRRVENSE
ncbi:TIP-1 family-domain-containing protein [Durotheca rogersii]|uniref:TIP-1 family-domain-containing protein n=1 Tax=Durotheca rogersii TaxID=419775 RepID=UPI00221EE1F1|nr:TIP-1 family-domain-containing protein [Durotheca rogersii]KAI5863866.1 TIP-1 family-domain-containing protein [Durotheca rogersii]